MNHQGFNATRVAVILAWIVAVLLVAWVAFAEEKPAPTPVAADALLVERIRTLSAHIYTRQAQIETLKTQAQLEALEAARRLGIQPEEDDLDVGRGLFVPPLDTMNHVYGSVGTYESVRQGENHVATAGVYVHTATQHPYGVAMIDGAVAIVDDHQDDPNATDWWIDPGLVTDDIPPKAQASPKSTCLFHRRGEST